VLFCEVATKGIVQNMTTLFFMGGGPPRGATSRRLGIILAWCHIMNYFCPKSFLIQFCTGLQEMHPRKIRENIGRSPRGVGPYNREQTMVPTAPGRHRCHGESDLDLGGGPGNSEKIKKIEK
jgi:hypothetical protein